MANTPTRNLTIRAGSIYTHTVTLEGVDLSGDTWRSQIRRTKGNSDRDPEASFDVDVSLVGSDTVIVCELTAAQTKLLKSGWVYDVEDVTTGVTHLEGRIRVEAQVSQ